MEGPINLNRARKQRDKAAAKAQAAENRAAFGRTRAEREAEKARKEKAERELEGKRRGVKAHNPTLNG